MNSARTVLAMLAALLLSSCYLSHERAPDDPVPVPTPTPTPTPMPTPSPLSGDWTYTSVICNSFNRLAWLTVCEDGETGWVSDFADFPSAWRTAERRIDFVDETRLTAEPLGADDELPRGSFTLDASNDVLRADDFDPDAMGCGVLEPDGARGTPEELGLLFGDLEPPVHPCP